MYSRPDRPLVVKCTFDKWQKKITFSSARNCTYNLLRDKVEQCFSLYATSYAIAYKDDDGEISNITTETDLTEAIQYFQAGTDDAPLSSAASILSGRSFGARKVTLRVNITVDYDGPSLSDTGSLASLEEYRGRNGSQQSFSFGAPSVDLDDDSVTVSSRDNGGSVSHPRPGSVSSRGELPAAAGTSSESSSWQSISRSKLGIDGFTSNGQQTERRPSGLRSSDLESNPSVDESVLSAAERYPADPSAVFERLKIQEAMRDDASSVDYESLRGNDRGAAWLRDQNERAIRSKLGALPEPSEPDTLSLSLESEEELGGDLALERDPRGKYYYTYTSVGSSASQTHGSGYEEGFSNGYDADGDVRASTELRPRPSSMHLNWLAAQQVDSPENRRPRPPPSTHHSDPLPTRDHIHPDLPHVIDKEFLPFLPLSSPPAEILTDCSSCGVYLDAIRYVCSTCGEKPPVSASEKGKEKDGSPQSNFTYPPSRHPLFSSGGSSSSRTYIGSSETVYDLHRQKPLPSLPSIPSLPAFFGSSEPRRHLHIPMPQTTSGYELCSGCIESAGIDHAVEAVVPSGTSPNSHSPLSPSDGQRALQLRRSAPKKGQLRHAYKEKVWGHHGWEDVEQDENQISHCSTCSAVTFRKRYKCASCPKMHLCRACYSQVHELHPSHAFLNVPDRPTRVQSEPDHIPTLPPDPNEELSLKHPGVKCAHCLLDIVGARFHCAICDSVDICSNCESAGLPGNLDSSDGGHSSSHILIKIPYPLETTELQSASRRAIHLWTGRDAASVGFTIPRSKAGSEVSSYARTVVGSSSRNTSGDSPEDHGVSCRGCSLPIFGTRYQCAHCASSPQSYSLCTNCEGRSYLVHDPMHIFFKLPRPVQRLLESAYPMLPPLYKTPAGPQPNAVAHSNDPRAYLKSLVHSSAICDRCMTPIEGAWFRCAYCPRDLCDACEEVDTHDESHVFMVFKSLIDMQLFKGFAHLENPNGGPPVIPYPVYR
ncbi:hypothetical protein BDQ12DRAFT_649491 [Crucibulum laeve]|uniref:ZZ-type domain-containing protein n=1 Tax=Crucibulum laeve TaxID=68775 RepID=A0A5C3M3W8_9AGAR|nr:hypothetical protein BDQ12DRAFT_649491 [Crucibulum laeve]